MNKKTRKTIIVSQAFFAVMYTLMKYMWIGFSNLDGYEILGNIISMTIISTFIIGWSVLIFGGINSIKVKEDKPKKAQVNKEPQKA